MMLNVGNVDLNLIIDSEGSCNIMGMPLWNNLKEIYIICVSSENVNIWKSKNLEGGWNIYSKCESVIPLYLMWNSWSLMGRDKPCLVEYISNVGCITYWWSRRYRQQDHVQKISRGKLKSFKVEILIDPEIEPVIQLMRWIPFSLRDKIAKKLDELLDFEIIVRTELRNNC